MRTIELTYVRTHEQLLPAEHPHMDAFSPRNANRHSQATLESRPDTITHDRESVHTSGCVNQGCVNLSIKKTAKMRYDVHTQHTRGGE